MLRFAIPMQAAPTEKDASGRMLKSNLNTKFAAVPIKTA